MPTTKTKAVLKVILDYEYNEPPPHFREWFLKQFEGADVVGNSCCLEEFADYFLNSLRQNTEKHLKVNSGNGTETPKSQTPVRTLRTKDPPTPREYSQPTSRKLMLDLQQLDTSTPSRSFRMNENSQNSTGGFWTDISQMVSNSQISDNSQISVADCSSYSMRTRLSTSADRSGHSQRHDTSTPIRRKVSSNSRRLSTTPTSSVCLGDFLDLNKSNTRVNKKKNSSVTLPNQNQSGGQQHEKPKKRVQPTSLSRKIEKAGENTTPSIFMGESSFSNENNILKISHTEVENKEQCAILAARKILKSNASAITKELTESPIKSMNAVTASTPTKQQETAKLSTEESPLNLGDLEKNKTLQRLVDIYVTLIDLNLTTNFLNELSFLLNLLNASSVPSQNDLAEDFERLELQNEVECSKSLNCLMDISHAVCFAVLCLNQQRRLLASLDSKTLKVIINNERFSYLKEDVRAFLLDVYQRKQLILAENNINDTSFCFADTKSCANVYFQQDQHSRQNFSSNQEFYNFRSQRDLFCKCLKMWETNHLNPNWKFNVEVGPTIREIFQQSELFVNMAHFANLFVSQLLISASNASSPEEIGLDVDMQKLSRLTQRLIAPSQFSVDYQFPRAQAFFRDFILKARSLAFAEQLKMVLYSELLSLNDSSFEHINITKAENETDNHHDNSFIANFTNDQIAVRPDILNSMLILAKFLGFTISLPYTFNASINLIPTAVEKKQIHLRSLIQPNFDLHSVVQAGIEEGKLLITIPWMVQYISMLDSITLQLEVHGKVLKLLFALYWYLAREGASTLHTTSTFIITACLSWLFDSKQIITEQYYNFRLMQTTNSNECSEYLMQIRSKMEKFSREVASPTKEFTLNPVLEALLPVACPFLGEFRVSIMPAKYASTKYASRSGRYRHITTRIAEIAAPALIDDDSTSPKTKDDQPKATQKSLIQAFFHSQNSSIRQLISFCSERCYKSVVRDAQLTILLPCKSKADAEVNKINSSKYQTVYKEINIIYRDAHKDAVDKWRNAVPKMLDKRIKSALDSLLPADTSAILKQTYFMTIKNNAKHKISQWFHANIFKDNYFCVDLQNMANKICTADKTKQPSDLRIVDNTPSLSELISSLQYWLHCTSVRLELFQDSKPIIDLMQRMKESLKNVVPTMLYRLLASYTIQLLQNIIIHNCVHLTDELIEAACRLLFQINMDLKLPNNDKEATKDFIYGSTITVSFLQSIVGKSECYTKFGQLVIAMIKNDIISMNYANQLFVSIFKHDWPSEQLNEISNMLRNISQATTASVTSSSNGGDGDDDEDDEKSNLFMDMLADLSRDVDLY